MEEKTLSNLAVLLYNNIVTLPYNIAQVKDCRDLIQQILVRIGAPVKDISNTPNPKDILDNANSLVDGGDSNLRVLGTLAYLANSVTMHTYALVTAQPDANIAAFAKELYDLENTLTILEKAQELMNERILTASKCVTGRPS